MVKFGTSMLSWISKWTTEDGKYAIAQTAKCGFRLLEISLTEIMLPDAEIIKKELLKSGIEPRFTMILPKEFHLTSFPEKALKLLKSAVDLVELMEGKFLGGVLYSSIAKFTGKSITQKESAILQNALSELCSYAEPKGIVIALEPINRYESYICNTSQNVLDLNNQIDAPNISLMLDTFHMNIEENGFYKPIIKAGNALKYMHISESDRGMLGEGNVHWDNLFKGLSEIKFDGDLVLENFSSFVPGLAEATSLWQTSKYDAETLAKGSLNFMRSKASMWGIDYLN